MASWHRNGISMALPWRFGMEFPWLRDASMTLPVVGMANGANKFSRYCL